MPPGVPWNETIPGRPSGILPLRTRWKIKMWWASEGETVPKVNKEKWGLGGLQGFGITLGKVPWYRAQGPVATFRNKQTKTQYCGPSLWKIISQ